MIGSDPRTDLGTHIPTSLVEELQNAGKINALKQIAVPALDRQYIGKFPDTVIPQGRYDFIYDSHGPLYYVDLDQRGTEEDSTLQTYDLLSERGILYAASFWPMERVSGVRRALSQKSRHDSATLFIQGNDPKLLVIKPGNPLYEHAQRSVSDGGYNAEEGVIRLKNDTQKFYEQLFTRR